MVLAGFAGASAVLPLDDTTCLGLLDTGLGICAGAGEDSTGELGALSPSGDGATFAVFGGGFLVEMTSPDVSFTLATSASSAEGGLIKPSRSALRRTRSAWASTMLEEWLFTPMPRAPQSSITSLLLRFSSRASS